MVRVWPAGSPGRAMVASSRVCSPVRAGQREIHGTARRFVGYGDFVGIRLMAVVAASSVLVGACTWSRGDSGGRGFPAAPASCAGPARDDTQYEASRRSAWDGAAGRVERARADHTPVDVWLSLSRPVAPEDAATLTKGFDLLGVMVVYPSNDGLYGKAMIPLEPGADVAASIRSQVQRRMLPTLSSTDPATIESRRRLAAGDVPVGAVQIRGRSQAVAALVRNHPCQVYGAMGGGTSGMPPLSAAVAPA